MKVILLQTVVTDYRQKVVDLLAEHWGRSFHVWAGPDYFTSTVKTGISPGKYFSLTRNHFLLGRRLLWQSGMWRPILRADVVILEMNPRILSTWLIIGARKLLRRKTVLWGHAWPRTGKGSKSDKLRHLMRSSGDAIIAYTETQATELREMMPRTKIVAAPNALYSVKDMGAVLSANGAKDFIYVGRMIEDKKPQLLLDAVARALPSMEGFGKLVMVGDGPVLPELKERASKLNIEEHVVFTGHVGDVNRLRDFYANSLASFSPGYVGLSITQSFAFGVPMVISRDEPHSPEIEAATEGQNSLFFQTDSVEDLAKTMTQLWNARATWVDKREAIAADCAGRYSAELMAERIVEATR